MQVVFGRFQIVRPSTSASRTARSPAPIFLNGASIGLLYGLLGMGLILVYRANRIINFAQAQLGAVPAVVALLLIAAQGRALLRRRSRRARRRRAARRRSSRSRSSAGSATRPASSSRW